MYNEKQYYLYHRHHAILFISSRPIISGVFYLLEQSNLTLYVIILLSKNIFVKDSLNVLVRN